MWRYNIINGNNNYIIDNTGQKCHKFVNLVILKPKIYMMMIVSLKYTKIKNTEESYIINVVCLQCVIIVLMWVYSHSTRTYWSIKAHSKFRAKVRKFLFLCEVSHVKKLGTISVCLLVPNSATCWWLINSFQTFFAYIHYYYYYFFFKFIYLFIFFAYVHYYYS